MCGICGKISLNGNVTEELIRKMCGVLTHRGPDDEGVMVLDCAPANSQSVRSNNILRAAAEARYREQSREVKIGLGHRRLAVIDLSPAGHQPMSNEDGSLWIVLNGEIYNFIELKEKDESDI